MPSVGSRKEEFLSQSNAFTAKRQSGGGKRGGSIVYKTPFEYGLPTSSNNAKGGGGGAEGDGGVDGGESGMFPGSRIVEAPACGRRVDALAILRDDDLFLLRHRRLRSSALARRACESEMPLVVFRGAQHIKLFATTASITFVPSMTAISIANPLVALVSAPSSVASPTPSVLVVVLNRNVDALDHRQQKAPQGPQRVLQPWQWIWG